MNCWGRSELAAAVGLAAAFEVGLGLEPDPAQALSRQSEATRKKVKRRRVELQEVFISLFYSFLSWCLCSRFSNRYKDTNVKVVDYALILTHFFDLFQ